MAAASLHINFYLEKLMAIDKGLGGTEAISNFSKSLFRKKSWG